MTNQEHYDKCVTLYEKGGASAVYDYANENDINTWEYCEPCDAETPSIDLEGNTCLVCGTSK